MTTFRSEQPDLFEARERGKRGAKRAADHAENDEPGWVERAYQHLTEFCAGVYPETFMAEDFVEVMKFTGDEPPDGRAYGYLFKKASKEGLIIACGYAPAKSSNGSPKVKWMARAPGEAPR